MSEFFDYLKSNMKVAVKSVRFNRKKYLPFFAAVFIVGMLFSLLLFSADEASRVEKETVARDYDWHVSIRNLNEDQYLYLAKYASPNNRYKPLYEIADTSDSPGYSVSDPHYDVKLRFIGGEPADAYVKFRGEYLPSVRSLADKDAGVSLSVSPLTENTGSSVRDGTALAVFCIFLLSLMFLTVLYSVRINNYRFEYGIYMTFGADFRKLSENAVFEMLTVTLITFLPSAVTAYIAAAVIHGGIVRIGFWTPFLALGLLLVCTVVSVIFPMFTVSRTYPMKNIIAEDNSAHVTSPRVSFEMLGKKIGVHYELFSAFRFRKYIVKTVTVAVAFMSAASAVLVASGMAQKKQDSEKPQFRLDFAETGYRYDEHVRADVMALEGVSGTEKTSESAAMYINSHMMFTDGEVVPLSGLVVPSGDRYDDYAFCTDNAVYRSCDAEVLDSLEKYGMTGDPGEVLTGHNYVIVGEYLNNQKKLKLQPGDKICAAVYDGYNEDSRASMSELENATGKKRLKLLLELYNYRYIELTVAAVLTDIPCGENLPVYMSEETYLALTQPDASAGEAEVDYTSVSVYAAEGLSNVEISALEDRLNSLAADYGSFTVTNLYADSEKIISDAMKVPGLCAAAAVLIALVSPVIWFFSQLIFYRKRYPEMDILSALGAVSGEIRGLFVQSGVITGVLSAVVSAAMTALVLVAVNAVGNYIGSAAGVFYGYEFPAVIFALAVAVSALLAFFSAYLPGIVYRRMNSESDRDVFSGE